jgi:Asp-tRNA(Asn)/Glu-tRNA(Gln) amidotransferase A subunit family amidase
MARRIADIALALDAVIGPDPIDFRSLPMPEASWTGAISEPHVPLQVAWSPTLGYAPVDPEILAVCERAVLRLEDLGVEVVRVDDVFPQSPLRTWITLASTYLARTVDRLGPDADADAEQPTLAALVEIGRATTGLEMVAAEDACHALNASLVRLFADHRVLLTPTVGGQTPLSGEPWARGSHLTFPFNLTRSPAGTVCAGLTAAGMPVGLQVVGPQHGDQVVLRTLAALEGLLGLFAPPQL